AAARPIPDAGEAGRGGVRRADAQREVAGLLRAAVVVDHVLDHRQRRLGGRRGRSGDVVVRDGAGGAAARGDGAAAVAGVRGRVAGVRRLGDAVRAGLELDAGAAVGAGEAGRAGVAAAHLEREVARLLRPAVVVDDLLDHGQRGLRGRLVVVRDGAGVALARRDRAGAV